MRAIVAIAWHGDGQRAAGCGARPPAAAKGTHDREGHQMTTKADFNAEEWSTVVDGPLYAGMRVISADRGGTVRETLALGRAYQEARARHGESGLLDELVTSPPAIDPERVRESGGDIGAVATEQLREAIGILEAKATAAETDAYKTFVMTVAQAVASARSAAQHV